MRPWEIAGMLRNLRTIALAISFLGLAACAGFLGPESAELSPEELAAQEKAQAAFESELDFSFENSAESVVLAACTDLYDQPDGFTDYVQIMECYREQVIEPEAQAQSRPLDLSPKSLAPKDLSPKY